MAIRRLILLIFILGLTACQHTNWEKLYYKKNIAYVNMRTRCESYSEELLRCKSQSPKIKYIEKETIKQAKTIKPIKTFSFFQRYNVSDYDKKVLQNVSMLYDTHKIIIKTTLHKVYNYNDNLFYGQTFNYLSDCCLVIARELINNNVPEENITIEIIGEFTEKVNQKITVEVY